jgi:hypothetical protein
MFYINIVVDSTMQIKSTIKVCPHLVLGVMLRGVLAMNLV